MFQFTILRRYEYVYRNNCYNTLYDSICTVMVQQHLLLLYSIVCTGFCTMYVHRFFSFSFSFLPKNYFAFCRGGALLNLVFTLISIITGHFFGIFLRDCPTRFSTSSFFYYSNLTGPLTIGLTHFRFCLKIRRV